MVQLLKASNVKLQGEVVVLERRVGELEVEKDTNGTLTFGGGSASTKALRRMVSIPHCKSNVKYMYITLRLCQHSSR
jgi:tRNA A37 threonylcarbamoyltransferase TsaD